MKLKIRSIARVKNAEVDINGITIIAGSNSTGKSTVSKALFSVFNTFYKINTKVRREKIYAVQSIFRNEDKYFEIIEMFDDRYSDFEALINRILEANSKKSIQMIIEEYENIGKYISDIDKFSDEILEVINVPKNSIITELIERYFNTEFSENINNINSDALGEIELLIRDKMVNLSFKNNKLIKFSNDLELTYQGVYIDDPFVIDSINVRRGYRNYYPILPGRRLRLRGATHREKLIEQYRETKNSNVIQQVLKKEKIGNILKTIEEILQSDKMRYTYDLVEKEDNENVLSVDSLSSGMKSFYLLQKLIENGTITDNGTVIFDEPEVHLHPKWQLLFAEIIVILQKEMNLHILLNTHSPYFLRAIEIFSIKHQISDSNKYYLSYENEDGLYEIEDATDNLEKIYELLTEPLQTIENVRSELDDE